MNRLGLVVTAGIVASLAFFPAPASAQAMGYKTYFFKAGNIRQILVYAWEPGDWTPVNPKPVTWIMNIYTDPPVEGKGILTFTTASLPVEEKRFAYHHLTQLASLIRSGEISGVAYSPNQPLVETNPSPYFLSETLPPGKQSPFEAYRILGFYSLPWTSSSPGIRPVMMQMHQANPPPASSLPPSITGTWNSNIGLVYQIQQQGSSFTWTVAAPYQTGSGTIQGQKLTTTWREGQQQLHAEGTVTAVDSQNRATSIVWNNGIQLYRQ